MRFPFPAFVSSAVLAVFVSGCSGGGSPTPAPLQTSAPTSSPIGIAPTATPVAGRPTATPGSGVPTATPAAGSPTATPNGSGPTPTPTPVHTATAAPGGPTPTPLATSSPVVTSAGFNDWTTHDYDNARDGFNPNSTLFAPSHLSGLHLAWQTSLGGGNQAQPLVITNVAGHAALLIVVERSQVSALDAQTGAVVWGPVSLGEQYLQDCGDGGIGGTPVYDPAIGSLFVAAGNGGSNPNHVIVSKLDVATGNVTGSFDATPTLLEGEAVSAHSGMTFANGLVYLGTASNCEQMSWRGRVLAIDPVNMDTVDTFFTTYGQGGTFGGGSIWSMGGLSADGNGNVYYSTGNAETNETSTDTSTSPGFTITDNEQAGYAEHLVKMTSNLATVEDSAYPGFNFTEGYADLDFVGVPVLFQPNGCNLLSGTQGKGGTVVIADTTNLSNSTQYMLSESSGLADYIGNPGYSPVTQLLYAPVASSKGGSLEPPGMVAVQFSCPSGSSSILWHAQFGPDSFSYGGTTPRSSPVATAGGVVFQGTPCTVSGAGCGTPSGSAAGAMWAVDASTGTVLNGGNPVLTTPDNIRLGATVDGEWMWVQDNSGNLYALTLDPSVPAAMKRPARRITPSVRYRN